MDPRDKKEASGNSHPHPERGDNPRVFKSVGDQGPAEGPRVSELDLKEGTDTAKSDPGTPG